MQGEVIGWTNLQGLANLSATCKELHQRINDGIELHMCLCFAQWGLSWMSVRFLLVRTDSLVSGLWTSRLLFIGNLPAASRGGLLELFVKSEATRGVLRYFEMRTSWRQVR